MICLIFQIFKRMLDSISSEIQSDRAIGDNSTGPQILELRSFAFQAMKKVAQIFLQHERNSASQGTFKEIP